MGLVGTGGVHSHADTGSACWKWQSIWCKEVYLHCITDGRDTDPHSGKGFLADLQAKLDELGVGKIASVSGRYYAMDRDNNWDREEKLTPHSFTVRATTLPTLPRPLRHPMLPIRPTSSFCPASPARAAACRMAILSSL